MENLIKNNFKSCTLIVLLIYILLNISCVNETKIPEKKYFLDEIIEKINQDTLKSDKSIFETIEDSKDLKKINALKKHYLKFILKDTIKNKYGKISCFPIDTNKICFYFSEIVNPMLGFYVFDQKTEVTIFFKTISNNLPLRIAESYIDVSEISTLDSSLAVKSTLFYENGLLTHFILDKASGCDVYTPILNHKRIVGLNLDQKPLFNYLYNMFDSSFGFYCSTCRSNPCDKSSPKDARLYP